MERERQKRDGPAGAHVRGARPAAEYYSRVYVTSFNAVFKRSVAAPPLAFAEGKFNFLWRELPPSGTDYGGQAWKMFRHTSDALFGLPSTLLDVRGGARPPVYACLYLMYTLFGAES